jgi:hypothetical protein
MCEIYFYCYAIKRPRVLAQLHLHHILGDSAIQLLGSPARSAAYILAIVDTPRDVLRNGIKRRTGGRFNDLVHVRNHTKQLVPYVPCSVRNDILRTAHAAAHQLADKICDIKAPILMAISETGYLSS